MLDFGLLLVLKCKILTLHYVPCLCWPCPRPDGWWNILRRVFLFSNSQKLQCDCIIWIKQFVSCYYLGPFCCSSKCKSIIISTSSSNISISNVLFDFWSLTYCFGISLRFCSPLFCMFYCCCWVFGFFWSFFSKSVWEDRWWSHSLATPPTFSRPTNSSPSSPAILTICHSRVRFNRSSSHFRTSVFRHRTLSTVTVPKMSQLLRPPLHADMPAYQFTTVLVDWGRWQCESPAARSLCDTLLS